MASGRRLGPFELLELRGLGAFGEVWAARHRSGERVALKVGRDGVDPASVRREAQHLAALDHGAVVHVYDVGLDRGRAWMAMELAQGTLAKLAVPLDLGTLAAHLLEGLAHVHASGRVHRDLKPSNILVGCAPRTARTEADRAGVRIADFGVVLGGDADATPRAGSRGWAAPEQSRGQADARSDVYSLALVLRSLADLPTRQRLAPWVARATREAPDDRFPTAAHALAALPLVRAPALHVFTPVADRTELTQAATAGSATQTVAHSQPLVPAAEPAVPCGVVDPPWPSAPPIQPLVVPRPRALEAGLGLLPFRTLPPIGRLDLLVQLWPRAENEAIVLCGAPEDVDEVRHWLQRWGSEVARPVRVRIADDGVHCPPLEPWHRVRRAEALGFDTRSATWLALDERGGTGLDSEVEMLIAADLIDVDAGRFVVRGRLASPVSSDPLSELEEAWWHQEPVRLARALAGFQPTDAEGRALSALYRSRLERPQALSSFDPLERLLGELDDEELCAALRIEGLSIAIRSRESESIRTMSQTIESEPEPSGSRLRALRAIQLAYAAFTLGETERCEPWLEIATATAERFDSVARALRVDIHLRNQEFDAAVAAGREAVERLGDTPAEDALNVHLALVNAMAANKAPEDEIRALLDQVHPLSQGLLNRAALGRYTLFRAQSAMRLHDWVEAERLLAEAADLYRRSGGSAVYIVLNQGLVGLHRGDPASVRMSTPADWSEQTEAAAAYVRPIMQLHRLFATLEDPEGARAALEVLEAGDPLPTMTHEGILLAAGLAPASLKARIAALAQRVRSVLQ